ncbi:MAG: glucose 1-dehydrogenase [Actinomycetota bacterium]
MARLESEVAIVTGGARGLGRAIAEVYVAEGARVCIADVRIELAQRVAEALGDSAIALELDVTDEQSWNLAIGACEQAFGSVSVLVNNAGLAEGAAIDDTTLESYRRVTEVNQTGVFLGMKSVIPAMKRVGHGSIINMSSIDGLVGSPRIISYIASKWAVRGMTKAVAMEMGPYSIRVNSIHPGHVVTELGLRDGVDPSIITAMVEEHTARHAPMQRTGTPQEIAAMAVFLASNESSYCTGAEFVVDGGFTAGYPAPGSPNPF